MGSTTSAIRLGRMISLISKGYFIRKPFDAQPGWGRKANHLLQKAVAQTLENRTMLTGTIITVNSLLDDGTVLNNDVYPPVPYITLRNAVIEANSLSVNSDPVTINFKSTLLANGPRQINLTQGVLTLDDTAAMTGNTPQLTIQGPTGTYGLTISGQGVSGVFNVSTGSSAQINHLTIQDGDASNGGAINNAGTLTVDQCSISSNIAAEYGGGIYNTGSLTVQESTISGNSAESGGGIYNRGNLDLTGSTLEQNAAGPSSPTGGGSDDIGPIGGFILQVGFGGGLDDFGSTSTATISGSTISGNYAMVGGGVCNDGTLNINQSTLSGNQASQGGGGLYNGGDAYIYNSTLSGNAAQTQGGGIANCSYLTLTSSTLTGNTDASDAGAIYNQYATTITDSTIAYNSADANGIAGGIDNVGTATIDGTIIAGNTGGDVTGTYTGNDNLIGGTPLLAALGNYGGPTQTMPPLANSPALGAGGNFTDPISGDAISTDQRGFPLSNAGDTTGTLMPDIGAFQTNSIVVNTIGDDPVGAGLMSFTDATNLANAYGGNQSIGIDPSIITESNGTLSVGNVFSTSLPTNINEGANDTFTFASGSQLNITAWIIPWTDQNGNELVTDTATGQNGTAIFSDAETAALAPAAYAYDASGNYFTLPALDTEVAPATPSTVEATPVSPNEIDLSWANSSSTATSDEILISNSGTNFTYWDSLPTSSGTMNYRVVNLVPATSYVFEVVAVNADYDQSAPATAAAATAADPWGVIATGSSTLLEGTLYQLNLSLDPSASASEFGGWTVYWGDGVDGTPDPTVFTSETVTAYHTFAYGVAAPVIQIEARTAIGVENPLIVTAAPISLQIVPLAPTIVSAFSNSESDITVDWQDNSQCDSGITLLRSDNGGASFISVATFGPGSGSYDDTGLSPSSTYIYEVEADSSDGLGTSSVSSSGSITTQTSELGLTLTAGEFDAEYGSINVNWTYQGSDVSGWELEYEDTTIGTNYQQIQPLPAGQRSYDLGPFFTGDNYNIRIRADLADGTVSGYDSQQMTLTPTLFPSVTATPVTDEDGNNAIEVAWTLPQGIDFDSNTSVSIEYRGTSTAGNGWVKIDDGDFPIDDGFDYWASDNSTDISIGNGQSAQFRVEVDGLNLGGWGTSQTVQQNGTAGVAPDVSLAVNPDDSVSVNWPDDNGALYRVFSADQPYDCQPAASSELNGAPPPWGDIPSGGCSAGPGDHVYIIVEEFYDGSTGYSQQQEVTIPGMPAPGAPAKIMTKVVIGSSVGSNVVHLAWTNNSYDETGFKVERRCLTGN